MHLPLAFAGPCVAWHQFEIHAIYPVCACACPPSLQVHVCDGIKFVEDAPEGHYDIIVVDSSDPVGPAEVLFQKVRL